MANALVVRKDTNLAKRNRGFCAAQYVRMSTDKQQYSIENQAAVIATYAHSHALTIVETYADKGESGLRIRNRAGLTRLIEDVTTGNADFHYVLVYDVSRWGRFQDVDESAHYEFICKQSGIKVVYCAEQFDNDGSMLSNIVKNLKRVMAAEYSRELSVKVHAGACRFSRLGFKVGGRPGYALQRVLVDEKQHPKGILKHGDRKYLTTDHVRLAPGSTDQVAAVRWIYQRFLQIKSESVIAEELNRKGITNKANGQWNRSQVGRILRNENYVGNLIYNKRSKKLGEKSVYNSSDLWIRSDGCVAPIVDKQRFSEAQKLIRERRVDISEDEMLFRLRRTLAKEGRLSPAIIDRAVGVPCTATIMQHFGSLRNAYRLIGYKSKRNCEYLDSRDSWLRLTAELASQAARAIDKVGGGYITRGTDCLQPQDLENIIFRVARWTPGKKETHSPHWSIQRRTSEPAGWIVAVRLTEDNSAVLDYVLLPPTGNTSRLIRFSENARARRRIKRFRTAQAVVRCVSGYVIRAKGVSSPRQVLPNTRSRSGRAKRPIRRSSP